MIRFENIFPFFRGRHSQHGAASKTSPDSGHGSTCSHLNVESTPYDHALGGGYFQEYTKDVCKDCGTVLRDDPTGSPWLYGP